MKLPIQARPIVRSVSSAKFSDALMSGITASCNFGECAWIAGACAGAAGAAFPVGGPLAAAAAASGCIATTVATSPDCRPCVPALLEMIMNPFMSGGPQSGGRPGKDHYDGII